PEVFPGLLDRARELAHGMAREAKALHVLLAVARQKGCAANELLGRVGVPVAELAREVFPYAVGPLPRRFVTREEEEPTPARAPSAPPVVVVATAPPKAQTKTTLPPPRPSSVPPPAASVPAPAASAPPAKPQSRVSTLDIPATPLDPKRASRIVSIKRLAEGLEHE